jgi:hypothetical protein
MPLSALFFLMMGAGGFLVYSAVKDQHPWELFSSTLGAATSPAATTLPAAAAGTNPTQQGAGEAPGINAEGGSTSGTGVQGPVAN